MDADALDRMRECERARQEVTDRLLEAEQPRRDASDRMYAAMWRGRYESPAERGR
jgi:hypothetical protein